MDSNDYLYHLNIYHVYDPLCYGKTLFFQIGRLFCSPLSRIEPHLHLNWLELSLVSNGQGTITTNGVPTAVKKGDIYLSFPADLHQISSSKEDPLQYDFFAFNSLDPTIQQGFERLMKDFASPSKRLFHDEKIPKLVGDAISEMINKNPDEYSTPILEGIFEQIFLYMLRDFLQKPVSENFGTTAKEDELAFQLMHYVDSHLFTLRKLSELAPVFGYNYSYLTSVFRKTTGGTILCYFEKKRTAAAKSLLEEGKLKIKDIAALLNYSTLYSFSKAFKKETGGSPKSYQKEKKGHFH